MILLDNERFDKVNDNLSLIQKTDGLTFGTDALLLAAYVRGKHSLGAELGGGSGIISMLLLSREKLREITAYEIQPEYSELIRRNAELNSLDNRLTAVNLDIRDLNYCETFDVVFSNPPYMKADSGKSNENEKKTIARHEVCGSIDDFCLAAKKLLKYGGSFHAVYRPERLADIISAMRNYSLEPKRITFVHAEVNSESSMVLIEAKKGGKSGALLTPPLIIYADASHSEYSADMNYIMENGSMPKNFNR